MEGWGSQIYQSECFLKKVKTRRPNRNYKQAFGTPRDNLEPAEGPSPLSSLCHRKWVKLDPVVNLYCSRLVGSYRAKTLKDQNSRTTTIGNDENRKLEESNL
jgi:hypothetical protein